MRFSEYFKPARTQPYLDFFDRWPEPRDARDSKEMPTDAAEQIEYMEREAKLNSVSKGSRRRASTLRDISALEHVGFVFKGGVIYRDELSKKPEKYGSTASNSLLSECVAREEEGATG